MPKVYLAPGVYVEETDFRAKSIAGVGTSTTAFVGPTRKGPFGVVPELITSFGDFERMYGGFEDLDLSSNPIKNVNYIAHAVRAFFDNGGSRLYVSRVVPAGAAKAQSSDLIAASGEARFIARFPGLGGNGSVFLYQKATPTSQRTLSNAPIGSIVRLGGATPLPAPVKGTAPHPFALADGGKLLLSVDGTNHEITFLGKRAEAVGTVPLDAQTDLTSAQVLTVRIGSGPDQAITLPSGTQIAPAAIVTAINAQLQGGTARLTDANDAGAVGRLAIATTLRGKTATIRVMPNAALKFAASDPVTATGSNVNNLTQVTIAEIQTLLSTANIPVKATLENNHLVLRSHQTGDAARLAVRTGTDSVHTALGLPTDQRTGYAPRYYLKQTDNDEPGDWQNQSNAPLTATILEQVPNAQFDLLTLTIVARDRDGSEVNYDDLGFDPRHPRWIGNILAETPSRRSEVLSNPFAISVSSGVSALTLRESLLASQPDPNTSADGTLEPYSQIQLQGGTGGGEPTAEDYRAALQPLEALEEISIVAAPGHSVFNSFTAIQDALITHVSRPRAYQIAVLDPPPAQTLTEVRDVRSRIDSSRAALYYPWVVVANPLARPGSNSLPVELTVPPSGFICGIYAHNDTERGVHKAPANEVVRGALRFESDINFAQNEVLNPLGINCLRYFPGRGYRVWGARTTSSDPLWKYVNIRRYFNYLEASIDRSTQWAVFEPNGESLWVNIRDTIAAFLTSEWLSGALYGSNKEQAFFVVCDRSVMTQADLDNGRLICEIGVAAIYPAEFVIFRIGQKTTEART